MSEGGNQIQTNRLREAIKKTRNYGHSPKNQFPTKSDQSKIFKFFIRLGFVGDAELNMF